MNTTAATVRLNANQADALSIIEDGRENGVALESVIRELTAAGRLRDGIHQTIRSLELRGLVTVTVTSTEKIGPYGVYLEYRTRITAATR